MPSLSAGTAIRSRAWIRRRGQHILTDGNRRGIPRSSAVMSGRSSAVPRSREIYCHLESDRDGTGDDVSIYGFGFAENVSSSRAEGQQGSNSRRRFRFLGTSSAQQCVRTDPVGLSQRRRHRLPASKNGSGGTWSQIQENIWSRILLR